MAPLAPLGYAYACQPLCYLTWKNPKNTSTAVCLILITTTLETVCANKILRFTLYNDDVFFFCRHEVYSKTHFLHNAGWQKRTEQNVSQRHLRLNHRVTDTALVPSSAMVQRGPTTFYLRAILQRRDNSRATSNKMMYETTDSQDLKLKRENRWLQWVCHWNYYTTSIDNLLQISISVMSVVEASFTLSFLWQYPYVRGSKSEIWSDFFVCHLISVFRVDLLHRRKCALTHVCASKRQANFSAKSFSLGNLSLLTTF